MPFVYLHLDSEGVPFYVGKGSRSRANSKHGRNKRWKEVHKNGYTVVLLEDCKSEELASELEDFLIDFIPNLTNVKKNSDERHDYSKVDWCSIVQYDPTSVTYLRYKKDTNFRNPSYKKRAGDVAGYLRNKKLHGQIGVGGKSYAIHRVVWFLHHGELSTEQVVNHIDCDPTNNSIENLELCTIEENCNRKKTRITGQSNITNTGYANIVSRLRGGKVKLCCSITVNGVKFTKQLCASTLGYDYCISELISMRNKLVCAKEN